MSVGIGLSINNTRAVVEALFKKTERVRPDAEVPHRSRCRRVGQQEVPAVGRDSAAHRAAARALLHLDGVLRAGQRHLRDDSVSRALPGRVSLHGSDVARPAVRGRRLRRIEYPGGEWRVRRPSLSCASRPTASSSDIDRLLELAGVSSALEPGRTTILKDNISWHFPFPGANTTPWQLEGDDPGAGAARIHRPGLRPEQDGRDQRVQGRGSQSLRADLPAVRRACPLQLSRRRHDVGAVQAEGADAGARPHLSGGHPRPRLLLRQEHRPPSDHEVPHLHDHDRRDEERLRRPAQHAPALHPFLDPRNARRPARHPEGDSHRACSRSWTGRRPATGPGRGRCTRS